MAFQYSLVFAILVTEMVLYAVISLPLPPSVRKPLLETLNAPFHSPKFQIFFKCVMGFIFVLFIDAVSRMNKVTAELHQSDSGAPSPYGGAPGGPVGVSRAEIQTRRFYAQRNVYLCGLTLFLSLIVNRTYALVYELLDVKQQIAAQDKDAALDDVDVTDPKQVEKLKSQIVEKDAELATLKKQAAGLQDDYDSIDADKATKKAADKTTDKSGATGASASTTTATERK